MHGAAFLGALKKDLANANEDVRLAAHLAIDVVITRVTVWFAAKNFPHEALELRDVLGRHREVLDAGQFAQRRYFLRPSLAIQLSGLRHENLSMLSNYFKQHTLKPHAVNYQPD
jgi:hypothetical protein